MIIPNKYSGYQAGIRIYPGGGGGGGGGASLPGTGDSQIGNTGGTTGIAGAVIPPASTPFVSVPGMGDSQIGNTGGTTGIMGAVIPPAPPVSVPGMGDSQIGNTGGTTGITGAVIPPASNNTQQGVPSATGRPAAGSGQFYQPIYQPQYQNYNMGNRMGVSQYGQGFGGFGGFGGGFMSQMQQQFNPFTNSFSGGFGGGFMPQMQTPFQQPMQQMQIQKPQGQQTPFDIYNMPPPGGSMDMAYRPGAMTPQQQQAQQLFTQGREREMQQLSQMMRPMQQPAQQMQQPMQPMQSPFRSSGPSQPIVTRSAGMRGTPNVMRRAQGGITSLLDDVA